MNLPVLNWWASALLVRQKDRWALKVPSESTSQIWTSPSLDQRSDIILSSWVVQVRENRIKKLNSLKELLQAEIEKKSPMVKLFSQLWK